MMKRNSWMLSIVFAVVFIACGSKTAQESESKKAILSGSLEGLNAPQLYLVDLINPKKGPVDTAVVGQDGSFSFDYQPASIGFYRLTISQNVALILPLEAGDQVKVSGSAASSSSLEVTGTKNAERMAEFNAFLQDLNTQQQQLNREFQQYANSPNKDSIIASFRKRFEEMEAQKAQKVKSLIDEDAGLFANIALMEQLPTSGQENIAYYKKVDEALAAQYSNSPFYQSFNQRMQEAMRFAPGTDVPEINLPNPDGELVPLSSLRGKVVLIDFWASWCKPCRRENPNVVAAYEKYKDKGFTVYGVSLDRTKEAWVNAIQQDNLNWTQVSDLKFWKSEAAQAYGVRSIPFALLIDEEGKVIGKNLRGPALHNKLEEVLN
ncbi:MAG: TlpA disulfide reductase family protein [Vicingaceae bacterium]